MEPSDQKRKHTWIAIAVTVGFFLFFFFGEIFFTFPRVFVLDIFGHAVSSSQTAITTPIVASDLGDDVPTVVDVDEILNHLSPPVSPELAGVVGILELVEGSGAVAVQGSRVRVGYIGTYIEEGTGKRVVFDSNTNPDTPFSFTIGEGSVISGFSGGIIGMREGGQRLVRIEPAAGYGSRAVGSIPPNTTLFFVIELYGIE